VNALKTEKNYARSRQQVEKSLLLPGSYGFGYGLYKSKRYLAIVEVLRRIPNADFRKLEDRIDAFCWFVPHEDTLAMVNAFPATSDKSLLIPSENFPYKEEDALEYSAVLYLSPQLEKSSFDIAIAIVAHELAHIVLKHKIITSSEEQYERQEKEVFACICRWGFDKEAKKDRAMQRRLVTFRKRQKKELITKPK
jgi:hypothetical protein